MSFHAPFLFLPGLLCDAALWAHQTANLADICAPKVVELPARRSITAIAEAILAKAPRRFALAGLSMGGFVALEMMRLEADRITKLALVATSARPDSMEQTETRRRLMKLTEQGKFKGVTPRLLPTLVHAKHLEGSVADTVFAMAERIGMETFLMHEEAIIGRRDQRPLLPKIQCPSVVIVGADDQRSPPELAHEMANGIPGALLHELPQCGHLPPLEEVEKTTAILRAFISQS
ncbi:MAG: alpha/beta fold hydrolase [Alphaproteobacteria bacterium]|nr:alpha/beta fold hydrolase [Alphaproteobacteria bacterium]